MHAKYISGRLSFRRAVLVLLALTGLSGQIEAGRSLYVPGRRALVIDERLSALRTQPAEKAPIGQRLRRGRVVGILGSATSRNGARYLRVAVSRNRSGWILSEAVVRAGSARDAEKLLDLIEATNDEFTKVRLARLCADEFRLTKSAPRALAILGEAAEKAAERLTREARRRFGDQDPAAFEQGGPARRDLFLNFAGLDRYNRLGVTFDYDPSSDRLIYDGAAYRELLPRGKK